MRNAIFLANEMDEFGALIMSSKRHQTCVFGFQTIWAKRLQTEQLRVEEEGLQCLLTTDLKVQVDIKLMAMKFCSSCQPRV